MVVELSPARHFRVLHLLRQWGAEGTDVLTARLGARALPTLERELRSVAEGGILRLSFEGVAVMDASFANASVIELAVRLAGGRYGDRYIVIEQASESTLFNLESAIARRADSIALLARDGKRLDVLTRSLAPNLAQAWAVALNERVLTARMLADRLHLEINAASTRLHKLHTARLLARREEVSEFGRQHIYFIPA